jgi:beta propeller repeat protein
MKRYAAMLLGLALAIALPGVAWAIWTDGSKLLPTWFGVENQGGDIALVDLDGNGRQEMFVFWIDNPAGENGQYYRIGWDIDPATGTARVWDQSRRFDHWGWEQQGAGAAFGDFNRNGKPDVIFTMIDNPAWDNALRFKVGWDVGTYNDFTGWTTMQVQVAGAEYGGDTQGNAVTVQDVNRNGTQDIVVVWAINGVIYYRVGWDMTTAGSPSSWSGRFTYSTLHSGAVIADLSASPSPEGGMDVYAVIDGPCVDEARLLSGVTFALDGQPNMAATSHFQRYLGCSTQGVGYGRAAVGNDRLRYEFVIDAPAGENSGYYWQRRHTELPVSTAPGDQTYPSIDGDKVVWTDTRNGNKDIYLYNLTTKVESRITTNSSDQTDAHIQGNRIVWSDYRNGNTDVYLFDLSTGVERRLTTDPGYQYMARIYGNTVVWTDLRKGPSDSDVYRYDLVTGVETPIAPSGIAQFYVRISGDRVVWLEQDAAGGRDLYQLILSTGVITRMTSNGWWKDQIEIDGDKVVWENAYFNANVAVFNLTTGITSTVADGPGYQDWPAISGNTVVWTDNHNGNRDIYMKDLVSGMITRLTLNASDQMSASISGNRVAYVDQRSGSDIYLYQP